MTREGNPDIFRALAIIGVLVIHVASAYLFVYDSRGTFAWNYKVVFDRLFRFCVPLFVSLSGFGLAKKYSQTNVPLIAFYSRRAVKLLPWYLFWSVVLYLSFHWLPESWPRVIFFGRGDYQLYFLPMIFQLYLLFPLLLWLVKKRGQAMVIILFLAEAALYQVIASKTEFLTNNNSFWPDRNQYLFFGSWIFYFVLGIYLGLKKTALEPASIRLKRTAVILVIVGLSWSLIYSFNLLQQGMDLIVSTRFTQLPVLVYSTGLIGFLLLSRPVNLGKALQAFLTSLGGKSYLIYLMHTAVLRIFFDQFHIQTVLPFLLVVIVDLLVAYWGALVLDATVNRLVRFLKNII